VAQQLWERGELELMTAISPAVWRALEAPTAANAWAQRGYHRIAFEENSYSWLGWNQARPPFDDVRVRRALAFLYPAELIARHIDLGLEPRIACPYSRESASCDPSVKPIPFEPASAARLLDEAGWTDHDGDGIRDREGKPLSFRFLLNAHSVRMNKVAPLLQETFRRTGLAMELERVESAVYLQRMRTHAFDGAAMVWSGLDVVQDQFQLFHSSQIEGGSNYVGFRDAAVDALLLQIRGELDEVRRLELERALHRRLHELQPYTFMSARTALDAASTRVHGLKPSLAWYDLRKVWLE
jgi:peptide/nickel transport system substrate-binding protein